MATTQTLTPVQSSPIADQIFTYFNLGTDYVELSSRTYYNQILPSGSIIGSVQNTAIRSFTQSGTTDTICSMASGSYSHETFATASIYSQYRTLLSNLTSSATSWKLIQSSVINPCTQLTAISFKKSLIGSAISIYNTNGRLSFRSNNTSDYYYVVQKSLYFPSLTYNIDSTIMASNVGIVIKGSSVPANASIPTTLNSESFAGLFFGQLGLIVLDRSNAATSNFFNGTPIQFNNLYNEQYINSKTYFCRITHQKYNFSNNPSWKVLTQGRWIKRDSIDFVAPTSIGLYNDGGQLLAIGKLSYPAIKHQNKEVHVQVVLRY